MIVPALSDTSFTLCPACETERTTASFVGEVCNFCYDKGKTAPVSEPETPPGPARKPRRKVGVSPQAPTPPQAPANASEEPYTAPQFDDKQAKANPQAELANRTLARRRLLPFIQRFRPKYDAGWVHKDICRRLERFKRDVELGKEPRLLLMTPPRLGKSEIGSRHFAPWVLGDHPDWEIIAASHTTSLSLSFSRYIRDLLRDPAYHAVFPLCVLDPNSQSTENWNLTAGGGYLAAGVGSAITGRGAHILVLDDLIKDIEASDSQSQRDSIWEWYISTAHSRLAPGGGVLGIMTSWSEDDWAGRIQSVMAGGEGDQFEIVRYPAINEVGDEYILADDSIVEIPAGAPVPADAVMTRPHNSALHEARYTLQALLRKKANYIASGLKRMWDSLYQQNPTPDEGIYFSKDMFRYYVHAPHARHRFIYQAWDFAITEGAQNDWTVGVTILQDENDNLFVLDVLRFRSADGNMIVDTMLDYYEQWCTKDVGSSLLGVEDGQIWKTLKSQFTKRCEERRMYPAYETLVPLTDKMVRANPLKGRMQLGKVYYPKEASWFPTYQRELLRFPAGKHDDCFSDDTMVDCPLRAVRMGSLKDGDEVLTYDGTNVIVGIVSDYHCTGVKLLLEVVLDDGTILEITPAHPVLTSTGYVYAGDLTSASQIVRKNLCKFRDTALSGGKKGGVITSPQQPSMVNVCGSISTPMLAFTGNNLWALISTTKTIIKIITNWITYSASQLKNMLVNTQNQGVLTVELQSNYCTSRISEARLPLRKPALTPALEGCEKVLHAVEHAPSARKNLLLNFAITTLRFIAHKSAVASKLTSTVTTFIRRLLSASIAAQNSSPAPTVSGIVCSAPRAAEIKSDTQRNIFRESASVAGQQCGSQKGTPQATVKLAEKQAPTNTSANVRPAGERFFPAYLMAPYSAIENVLTTPEDLRVTQHATSDTDRLFVKVVSARRTGFQPTYNFDVAGTRNFLIHGGVVVHNCIDATAWAVRLTLSRSAPKLPQPKELKSWRDKLKNLGRGDGGHMSA